MSQQSIHFLLQMGHLLAAGGFFVGLKLLSSPKSARKGNFIAAIGMLIAVSLTFFTDMSPHYLILLVVMAVASIVGILIAKKVAMTSMPQMVGIFNGLGGAASVFVACAEMMRFFSNNAITPDLQLTITSWFGVVVGSITFSGSLVAFGKLQGLISSRAILYKGQRFVTILLTVVILMQLAMLINFPQSLGNYFGAVAVSLVLGVLLVIPIGGADMPVVISLLNSYSGVAAMAAGFVVQSPILIIAGALVGASGLILTRIMCQAMNRSLANVIFGSFGESASKASAKEEKPMQEYSTTDACMLLRQANQVIVVPGYGLAVSQAQQNIKEVANYLDNLDVPVKYAIHPVAGRMPGHMNVLLAEANIPYEDLYDLDDINSEFENTDVAVIIGANDVVNPLARDDKSSPLYGMPILNADKAKSIIVMKRGRGKGFAGVENPLFTLKNSGVVFGDAKKTLVSMANELKEA